MDSMKKLLPLQVHEHTLSNGLTVWLNEDHSQPKVFGAVVVKAGAKDCPNTGIAHYFEHMMFKGTDKIGTIDYQAEKAVLDLIAEKYDALAETEDETMRRHLLQIINDLSIRAAEYVIPNEFDRLISRYGGTKLNAGTSYDYTVYFNTFSPQYMAQWAELNSERLRNPVFRLFQTELETVYEEKNMYSDMVGSQAIEKLTERYFYPHPYAYPIIGSTENLKNPRLSEMKKFFETYYVASNMGLILSGDFDTEHALPIIEKTFSRIRDGKVPGSEKVVLPAFKGKEKMSVKVPIPFLKVMVMGFRGVPANHEDRAALKIAVSLLNNSNGTGFLDKLTVEHKVVGSMAMNESMNETGILGVMVMPKLLLQTYSSAEKMVWKEINRVKNGEFSDETFQSLKLELKREYASDLEDISTRAQVMLRVYSQGRSWNDYLDDMAGIEALTKEDIMRIACKYFTNDYLLATKKTGRYPKDRLPKPDYAPIVPKNAEASSAYVKQLEQIPLVDIPPRLIDFEKDVTLRELSPLVHLYHTCNPVNDIFMLNLSFGIGVIERPVLPHVATFLHFIGTDTLSYDEFRRRLQVLGSTLMFNVNDMDFTVEISGFDNHLEETLELVGAFMRHPKSERKKLHQVVEEAKVTEKAFFKSSENMAKALLERVKYGDRSRYLAKLSLPEIKKLKGNELLAVFKEIQQVECNIHYSGTLPPDEVARVVRKHLPLELVARRSNSSVYRPLETYDKPLVYLFDMPDVSQSIVCSYMKGCVQKDRSAAHLAELFTGYFGGDMSSLMFQEIREFRSYAYRVNARYSQPTVRYADKPGDFYTLLSTQTDKTVDAIAVLDSLIKDMPERPDRIETVKQHILHRIHNEYPSFRKLSSLIATLRREGYTEDPNIRFLSDLDRLTMEDIVAFYRENIKNRPVVYAIVGNARQIDKKKLAAFGTIVNVNKKEIYHV